MSVYWIGRTTIVDPSPMIEYNRLTDLALKKHPRRTLARGGQFRIIEGDTSYDRFVLHEYASMEAALAFYNSEEYQQAVPLRQAASHGHSNLVFVEGITEDMARVLSGQS